MFDIILYFNNSMNTYCFTCKFIVNTKIIPWTNAYVIILDITNAIKKAIPKIKAKLSCFKCLAISDLMKKKK